MAVLADLDPAFRQGLPLAAATAALTFVAVRRVLDYLRRRQILDRPNERSSHSVPVPRGGGLAVTPVVAAMLFATQSQAAWLGAGALILLLVSWWDDRKGLPPLPRFAVQIMTVAAFLWLIPAGTPIFMGILPRWAVSVLVGLCWLWFINLYNFMDGIDGITGIETISIGVGIVAVAAYIPEYWALILRPSALIVIAAAAVFLVFNWHPAKLFLGDSGSVPLGFVLGGLLIMLAQAGQLAAAVILPAYYLADASITLGRRLAAGEKIWQAHRLHFYQRAVQGGKRHDQVTLLIAGGNASLIICAVFAAQGQTILGIGGAIAVVAAMLMVLQKWSRGQGQ